MADLPPIPVLTAEEKKELEEIDRKRGDGLRIDGTLDQIGGSMDGVKAHDKGDFLEIVATGTLMDCDDQIWIAGEGFEYRMEFKKRKTILYSPPIVVTVNKKEAENMSITEIMEKFSAEPLEKHRASLDKLCYENPPPKDKRKDKRKKKRKSHSHSGPPPPPPPPPVVDSAKCEVGEKSAPDC